MSSPEKAIKLERPTGKFGNLGGIPWVFSTDIVNPIPTGHGRNQPIYERHVTKSGRNRVKDSIMRI